jgi:hypothetical protein
LQPLPQSSSSPFAYYLSTLAGPLIAGLAVYLILSYLLSVHPWISAPLSVLLSILLFGLVRYYQEDDNKIFYSNLQRDSLSEKKRSLPENYDSVSNVVFIAIYIALLSIVVFPNPANNSVRDLFIPWEQFLSSPSNILQLGSGIALCFFVPGYALIKITSGNGPLLKKKPLLTMLLAYLVSILINGLAVYAVSSNLEPVPELNKIIIITINAAILLLFFVQKRMALALNYCSFRYFFSLAALRFWNLLRTNFSVGTVFASLFALVIFYTYYLDNGVINGDQWLHHGRALLINSDSFKDIAASGFDSLIIPPFFSALLASLFSLSDSPPVNAYVAINFLNMMPIFAVYYFFIKWMPRRRQRAAVLASTLFVLSSGFGWLYILDLAAREPITSYSTKEIFELGSAKTHDVRTPTTFMGVGHPTPTTPLLIITLPSGFILLGIIKEDNGRINKLQYTSLLVAIVVTGILSHPEFYLFIMIAAILLLLFRLPNRTINFASILIAFSITFFVNYFSHESYYTNIEMVGIPLLGLSFLLVCMSWITSISGIIPRLHYFFKDRMKLNYRSRHVLQIVTVSVAAYLYLFTFLVWDQLSADDITIQIGSASASDVPWYLYPMKLGATGLLGIAFVISYIFRKFEKGIFVFGIIAVVTLFIGSYYNEHRFSKYVMIGLAGFASLLIYEIIIFIKRRNTIMILASGMFVALVISSASFSILLFAGYKDMSRQDFHRTGFPTTSEMNFLNFLHKASMQKKAVGIAIPSNELDDLNKDISGKIESFTSIPRSKLFQSPFTMNSSNLEEFYDLLVYTNARYILLPEKNIDAPEHLSEPVLFALRNFQKSYQDDNYTVLTVPPLFPPSEKGDIALIYQNDEPLPAVSSKNILRYDNKSFDYDNLPEMKRNGKGITLHSDKKELTLWSKPIREQDYEISGKNGINYVEGKFRVIGENGSRNRVGILWEDANTEYQVSLRDGGLELSEKQIRSDQNENRHEKDSKWSLLSQNAEVTKEKGIWYTIKVAFLDNAINVYVDDVLKIHILSEKNPVSISKVGIRSSFNIAEFQPLKIAFSDSPANNNQEQLYKSHYYPLTMLALSKMNYSTYIEGDYSAFSKKNIILTFDPSEKDERRNNGNAKPYLEYVKKGGTLILMSGNSNDHSNAFYPGIFSKLLGIRVGNESKFNSIAYNGGERTLNISGVATDFEFMRSDITATSYYMYDNQKAAPFAIEKNYGNGKIIYVNAAGYFEATSRSPEQLFSTFSKIPNPIEIIIPYTPAIGTSSVDQSRYTGADIRLFDTKKIIENTDAEGQAVLNSSSVIILPKEAGYDLYAKNMSISNHQRTEFLPENYSQQLNEYNYDNVKINDLKLYGHYEAIINSSGPLRLPTTSSHYDYIEISIPTRFDMTLNLSDSAYAELKNEKNHTKPMRVTNGIIHLGEVRANDSYITSIPILMKSPVLTINGTLEFQEYENPNTEMMKGRLVEKIDYTDHYHEPYRNGSRTQFITYMKDLQPMEQTATDKINIDLRFPGEISDRAKEKGVLVPWKTVMRSSNSIILMISISIATIMGLHFIKVASKKFSSSCKNPKSSRP